MADTPHYSGHRDRLRQRFRKTGFDGMQEYEALELLLMYALPRRDVKPLAKSLIKSFGSLSAVFDAPYDELLAFKGLSDNSATYLKAIKGSLTLYLKTRMTSDVRIISSTDSLMHYCQSVMGGLKDEQFRAIYLNSQNQVIGDELIHEGIVNQSVVYPRKVMECALKANATAMIFVHNHPGGACKPSREDRAITKELVEVAKGLTIAVHDHLIICKEDYYSFRESGLL